MAALLFSNTRRNVLGFFTARARYLSVHASSKSSEESISDSRFLQHSTTEPRLRDHTPFLLFPQVRLSSLPNGIRVVTQSAPASSLHMASIGVWIDAGSRFEAPGTNGTAHFLEHMIFKGTRRRTSQSLEEEIENLGARLNAYTSREQTTFFADVQAKDIPAAVDVLADILQNSRFPEHAIKRERGVILREMEEVQGQMEEVIFDHLHAAAFYKHPLGDTILGPEENIQAISRVDLQKYISSHYTGPRMVVSAAGAVKHDEIVNLVQRLFTKFSRDPTTADQLVMAKPATFTACEVRVDNDTMPLAHVAVALKGAPWTDANSIPLMVIQTLLGSWNKTAGVGPCSGSELARRLSTEGLAESMMAFNTNYRDTGLFGVYCTASPDCLNGLSCVVMQEIRRLAYQVSEVEVARARNQLKSCLLLHIDGSTSVAENNGRQMLTYGRVVPFPELFARIDAVDAATVKDVARKFIINQGQFGTAELWLLGEAADGNCSSLQKKPVWMPQLMASCVSDGKKIVELWLTEEAADKLGQTDPYSPFDVAIAAMGPVQGLPEHSWFQSQVLDEQS